MNSASTTAIKILVVEDDAIDRTAMQRLLSKSPLKISKLEFAETFAAALQKLTENGFDVILLDLNLPDNYGMDTLIKINEKYPAGAIVVVTGDNNEEMGLQAVGKGAQEYLVKGSFNIYALTKSINYAIERKKAERQLQIAEERYRTIFENSAVAITVVDHDEHLISWNKFTESLLGMSREDLYMRPVKSLYPAEEWEKIKNYDGKQKGMQYHLETQMIKKDGEVIDVDISLSILKNPEEKTTFSIGIITDITERKKADRKLKETMEMKSQFVSTVSHELRTPLSCIKESVVLVLDEVVGKLNDEQKKFLNITKRNIDRLAGLVNDVLDFQKFDAGKMKCNIQENDIAEIIKEVHETMAFPVKNKNIDFSYKLDDNLPKIKCDHDKITQVLTNLIGNAVKFTPENGRISIHARLQDDDLAISIKDTGLGIPKESLSKIFEQFYRVQRPGKEIKGTGLGLAIVNKIIMLHGGRIEVESEPGKGSTFTVFLPLTPKSQTPAQPEKTDEVIENTIVDNQSPQVPVPADK